MATMSRQIKRLHEFGPFHPDPQSDSFWVETSPFSLAPKAVETLLVLVENRDHVVSKGDLMKMLWPATFVEESNLSQNIFMLREGLGRFRPWTPLHPDRARQGISVHRRPSAKSERKREREKEIALVVRATSRSELVLGQHAPATRWIWVGMAMVLAVVSAGGTVVSAGGLLINHTRDKSEGGNAAKSAPVFGEHSTTGLGNSKYSDFCCCESPTRRRDRPASKSIVHRAPYQIKYVVVL